MYMISEIRNHEAWMKERLAHSPDAKTREYHEQKIRYFQHERLVHLLVTLTVGIALLLSIYVTMLFPSVFLFIVDFLLTLLFVPYLIHYRNLENGVQKLYTITDQIYASNT